MPTKSHSVREETWLGNTATIPAEAGFNGGKLWIGCHSVDGDTLVFDPALADPTSARLSFFSLSQFRQRTFPSAVVAEMIHEITDELQYAKAKKQYKQWAALKAAHEHEQSVARVEAGDRQKSRMLEQHQRFLENRGIPYQGVRDTSSGKSAGAPSRRRSKCSVCGIALDDFVGSQCIICNGTLCSCGACGCEGPLQRD